MRAYSICCRAQKQALGVARGLVLRPDYYYQTELCVLHSLNKLKQSNRVERPTAWGRMADDDPPMFCSDYPRLNDLFLLSVKSGPHRSSVNTTSLETDAFEFCSFVSSLYASSVRSSIDRLSWLKIILQLSSEKTESTVLTVIWVDS